MVEDVVRSLGYLALASRLRRLGERLHLQAQPVLDACGAHVPAGHYPLLAALERAGPLGVGELAAALGVRQPGVTRILDKLKAAGLVKAARGGADRRQRPVALTRAGRELVSRSRQHIWPRLEAAVIEACGPASVLLEQLLALEQGLAARPLQARVLQPAAPEPDPASA